MTKDSAKIVKNIFIKIRVASASGLLCLAVVLGAVSVSSCHHFGEGQLEEVADSFSVSYFNWQFARSLAYCTPESRRWLSYMASQVNQTDIDVLKAQEECATCEIGEIVYENNDSVAKVEVEVSNFLNMDTIGKVNVMVEKARFYVPVVYRNEKWKVNLTGILRAEKDS